jgi:hypothetical protein
MYKKILFVTSFLCIGLIIAFATIIIQDFSSTEETAGKTDSKNEEKDNKTEKQEKQENTITELSEEKLSEGDPTKLNPFGDSISITELDDGNYQDYIHKMSHQKVVASDKWGFYRITDKRIEWLLSGLEDTDLVQEDLYLRILTRWKEQDFSLADQDHNAVWQLQGGTVGKATGVLTPKQEQQYLDSAE